MFNAGLYKIPPYDPLKCDLVPVALILNISYTLIGSPTLHYKTPKDIIAAAKANPGSIKLANAGVGTGQHVVGARFKPSPARRCWTCRIADRRWRSPICSRDGPDLFFDSTPAALPYIKSAGEKALRSSASKRNPDAPGLLDHDFRKPVYLA